MAESNFSLEELEEGDHAAVHRLAQLEKMRELRSQVTPQAKPLHFSTGWRVPPIPLFRKLNRMVILLYSAYRDPLSPRED